MNKDNTAEVDTFEEGKEQIYKKESNGYDSTIRILRWTGLLAPSGALVVIMG